MTKDKSKYKPVAGTYMDSYDILDLLEGVLRSMLKAGLLTEENLDKIVDTGDISVEQINKLLYEIRS